MTALKAKTTPGSGIPYGELALADAQLERLADLIADRIAARRVGELVDAAELARRLGKSRDFVYEHHQRLGAIRLGDGPRPRLAFRWPDALDLLTAIQEPAQKLQKRARRQTRSDLLPIRGSL